jgi:hypothetical protein
MATQRRPLSAMVTNTLPLGNGQVNNGNGTLTMTKPPVVTSTSVAATGSYVPFTPVNKPREFAAPTSTSTSSLSSRISTSATSSSNGNIATLQTIGRSTTLPATSSNSGSGGVASMGMGIRSSSTTTTSSKPATSTSGGMITIKGSSEIVGDALFYGISK